MGDTVFLQAIKKKGRVRKKKLTKVGPQKQGRKSKIEPEIVGSVGGFSSDMCLAVHQKKSRI